MGEENTINIYKKKLKWIKKSNLNIVCAMEFLHCLYALLVFRLLVYLNENKMVRWNNEKCSQNKWKEEKQNGAQQNSNKIYIIIKK